MKVSNETKVGALTIISAVLLVLGFNFLRGKDLFSSGTFIYAVYPDAKGLQPSNAVYIKGIQVGTVDNIQASNKNLSSVVVTLKIKGDYNIPKNSVASINTNPLGSPSIQISLGNSTAYLQAEDTIRTSTSEGLMGDITNKFGPIADQLTATLKSMDSVLKNINTVLDPNTKNNLQSIVKNLNDATSSIATSAQSLTTLLNPSTGMLSASLQNVESFTQNLASNNEKLNQTMSNLEKTTENFSNADIDGVINQLKASAEKLDSAMAMLNSTQGTLGALINDKEIYNSLNSTIRSLNILMDDLRVHPKRYVNISVFGKKDKGEYLTQPLPSDTASMHKK